MAKGHTQKKIKRQKKIKQTRSDRQYELRSTALHVQTTLFLLCPELIVYHLLEACTLATLIVLAHTNKLFRTHVKALYRIRLIGVVSEFVGYENVAAFFSVLEETDSAIGGSTLSYVLAPPIDDIDDWLPSNLNIFTPVDRSAEWDSFFEHLGLIKRAVQSGILRPYEPVTKSHVEYQSRVVVRFFKRKQ